MAIPIRGLTNIRTLAGRADQLRVPYRCYMQITCMEMEKARRGAERRSAMERVAAIDRRLACIELEKEAALMRIMESPGPSKVAARGRQRPASKTPSPAPAGSGFRIRY
jgi:hypothetical protein